ncbi:hypothetical protein QYM36_011827 [Artemia franciscana]|uniref:Uncharacterized protein n=1 Tax=Artemia franciscana TaxID=6661 RepID=A0AA88HS86_ARTSF|nr:hypothetical protein QYM36_011827 [Artemia franciscana]
MKRAGTSRGETLARLALEIAKEKKYGPNLPSSSDLSAANFETEPLICNVTEPVFHQLQPLVLDVTDPEPEIYSERAGRTDEGQEQEPSSSDLSAANFETEPLISNITEPVFHQLQPLVLDVAEPDPDIDSERSVRIDEGQEQEHNENPFSDQNGCSESNTKRKRNRSEESKKENNKRKHPFIEEYCDASCSCKKHCKEFDIEARKQVRESYWAEGYASRSKFLAGCIRLEPIKRRTVHADNEKGKMFKQNESRHYYLPKMEQNVVVKLEVCKKMLMNTFGFRTDSQLTELCKKINLGLVNQHVVDNRGKKAPHNKVTSENLEKISFGPSTPHYRRKNAPNIKYLSSSLTLNIMHQDFCEKFQTLKVSLETYRR